VEVGVGKTQLSTLFILRMVVESARLFEALSVFCQRFCSFGVLLSSVITAGLLLMWFGCCAILFSWCCLGFGGQ
jgi:hypothetical protein